MGQIRAESENDTAACAQKLAPRLRPGDVLLLEGDVGAGKSVFARALIRHLTGEPDLEVPSPTFTLVQTYDTKAGPVWHFDLYRLKGAEDIYELGWEEALSDAIAIVEWPERLEELLPPFFLSVRFDMVPGQPGSRIITLTPSGGDWTGRLEPL